MHTQIATPDGADKTSSTTVIIIVSALYPVIGFMEGVSNTKIDPYCVYLISNLFPVKYSLFSARSLPSPEMTG